MDHHSLRGKLILLVEDEFLIADTFCASLESKGIRVLGPFPNVEGGIESLQGKELPDAAILDVNLSDEWVYPLAERCREAGIPVLLTTGYDSDFIPEGFRDIPRLQKPVRLPQLLGELDRLLSGTKPH